MFKILSQPYPHNATPRKSIVLSIATGLFIASFLNYFQPFGSANWHDPSKPWILSGFGLVSTFMMLFNYFVVPRIFSISFASENWTVGKEMLYVAFNLFSIACGNIAYSAITHLVDVQVGGYIAMLTYTLVLGIFPATMIILINYIYHLKKYALAPTNIVTPTTTQTEEELLLSLVAENEKDKIAIPAPHLLYIESSDNYCTVYFLENETLCKTILRSSLTRLEGQIPENTNILRCHRSFIVNLSQVEKISGNAQGYRLHLLNQNGQVPVARKYAYLVDQIRVGL
ncbi:LytTR family DNA-binding domain-containing protein [Cellulophaga sp. BC115SP]|uniref:LytTR family DNA-binding domain-containing protein n=1 Tax=Cellulophaga sp. BC115SP TaxID=2683263 RepID=UPI001412ADED|nr:LytTR family DNA-binding domain-containing protein [Cellulophaga sp. BC115SP]NBB31096.1 LytTR family transcriptional regulator [Cellulophaga sp. BC115SP]